MLEVLIAAVFIALLIAASVWANRRFADQASLPMQWGISGQVNWTAPRRVALAFTPVLGGVIIGGTAALLIAGVPTHPGQEHMGAQVLAMQGMAFLAGHTLHLWLISRTVR
ncbi:MAG: hypothetical protein BGN86_13275 [Caulobacterales bacterium 68-7]|nr:hypothetical protein [Caulobacterales bacterium]OJU08315.1 MAG: hypothetical protein BGN86_13275 [Caulobacterales bacterium 68-7]